MKLYLLRPAAAWEPWYNSVFGFVVRAEDEREARQHAAEEAENEGGEAWLDSERSTCDELTADGVAGVVLRDFARA